jgi:hypothetical protein
MAHASNQLVEQKAPVSTPVVEAEGYDLTDPLDRLQLQAEIDVEERYPEPRHMR